MGNCITSTSMEAETMRMRLRSSRNRLESTHNSLRSRFQAVEGTLFLYRSIVLRNYLNAQNEATKMIEKVEKEFATFALKRQKAFESALKKIEDQRQVLHEKCQNLELKKNKKDAQNALSSAYGLIDDVADLITLEDLLQGQQDATMIKERFEVQFKKFEVDMEQVEEMAYLLDLQINKIDLTRSQLVKKSDLPFSLTTPQTSNA